MTRDEAREALSVLKIYDAQWLREAVDMAIEALQFAKHFDLLKEYQSLKEVVRCKDCKHRSYEGWCDVYIQPRMDTDFCNHGERQCNYFGERREP